MATVTPKPLVQGTLLTNVLATYYIVPPLTTATIRAISFCNTDTVPRTITLYLVASGGSASDGNVLDDEVSLEPHETKGEEFVRAMNTGDFIMAVASETNVANLRVDGAEITA